MPPKPLNLLNLPGLPMDTILSHLGMDTLVDFSFVSQRSADIVYSFRPQIEPIHMIFVKHRVELSFEAMDSVNCVNFECDDEATEAGKAAFIRDAESGVKLFVGTFRAQVEALSVDLDYYTDFGNFSLWSFIGKCDHVRLEGHGNTPLDFNAFFSQFHPEESFSLLSDAPNNLGDHFSVLKDLNALYIRNASWFGNEHLMETNCEMIDVKNTEVTPSGVNEWLRKWTQGADDRVEVVNLLSRHEFSEEEVLDGVPRTAEICRIGQFFRLVGPFQTTFPLIHGTREVVRADGAVARVLVTQHGVHLTMKYSDKSDSEE